MDLNKVMFIGNIVNDPESRSLPSGSTTCQFRMATNRSWTDQQGQKQEEAQFHNITTFGKLAEICQQYLQKGQKIYIEGRLRHSSYQAQDGQTKYWTETIAENMIMLSAGRGAGTQPGQNMANDGTPITPGSAPQTPHQPAPNNPKPATPTNEPPTISPDEPTSLETNNSKQEEAQKKNDDEVSVEDIPF